MSMGTIVSERGLRRGLANALKGRSGKRVPATPGQAGPERWTDDADKYGGRRIGQG